MLEKTENEAKQIKIVKLPINESHHPEITVHVFFSKMKKASGLFACFVIVEVIYICLKNTQIIQECLFKEERERQLYSYH